ncbi:hypothetical protein AV530_017887 [Patagioenas fasciata monilis]|uniref:Uncharacterized protein n=1 Tax=Patagioenas fasciata monilis TaxID=372326 RepID=A0A1V4JW17_PATFA|nr:hypothetical protein AV530_017887 [Patagioenas fasciata monilis]
MAEQQVCQTDAHEERGLQEESATWLVPQVMIQDHLSAHECTKGTVSHPQPAKAEFPILEATEQTVG